MLRLTQPANIVATLAVAAASFQVSRGAQIVGQTVAQDGSPLPGVVVSLSESAHQRAGAAEHRRVLTSATGQFIFRDLPAGRYTLTGSVSGHAPAAFGASEPEAPASVVELRQGEWRTDVRLRFWKYGVISGRVVDEEGRPLARMPVIAVNTRPALASPRAISTFGATTDDRGEYRVGSLPKGEYIVQAGAPSISQPIGARDSGEDTTGGSAAAARQSLLRAGGTLPTDGIVLGDWRLVTSGRAAASLAGASPANRAPKIYPPTFFGGPARQEAAVIHVSYGEERTSVDFLMIPVEALRVEGIVKRHADSAAHLAVHLMSGSIEDVVLGGGSLVASSMTDCSGRFVFLAVAPGEYVLTVRGILPPSPSDSRADAAVEWLAEEVAVTSGDQQLRTVALRLGCYVSGTLRESSSTVTSSRAGASVRFRPAVINPLAVTTEAYGEADEKGQFRAGPLLPGRYRIEVQSGPGWSFVGASRGQSQLAGDIVTVSTDGVRDLDLILEPSLSRLEGVVLGAPGASIGSQRDSVLVFTAVPALWSLEESRRVRHIDVGRAGDYLAEGLPGGEYFVVAVPTASLPADWRRRDFLRL